MDIFLRSANADFNTSYVSVERDATGWEELQNLFQYIICISWTCCCRRGDHQRRISIHHMYQLNSFTKSLKELINGISIHHMYQLNAAAAREASFPYHFNTSYVSVEPLQTMQESGTLQISIHHMYQLNASVHFHIGLLIWFQYIICISWTKVFANILAKVFQVIPNF